MGLRQGSRQARPALVWNVFIVWAVILLPGRARLFAQEGSQPVTFEAVNSPAPPAAGLAPPATGAWADQWQMVRIYVQDLVDQARVADQTIEQAKQTLLMLIPQLSLEEMDDQAAKHEVSTVPASSTAQHRAQTPVDHKSCNRIPILARLTKHGEVPLSEPLTDDEILFALKRNRPSSNRDAGAVVRIVKQKTAEYVDPQRFVPLIGQSQLHHAHYKCTVHFKKLSAGTEGKESTEVIYVDHNAFHLIHESK